MTHDEISWAAPLKRACEEAKPVRRWLTFDKAGHSYWIRYELTECGILKASKAVARMALRDVLLTLDDAIQIALELETELAKHEQRGAMP